MSKLKITQVKSSIGGTQRQRDTLRSLGLRRIRHSVIHEDRPEIRGMAHRVNHLVKLEEVSDS